MKAEEITMIDGPDAATFESRTLTGWWSKSGYFFGDKQGSEESARYNGATHKKCDCGNVVGKTWTYCNQCRSKKDYEKMMSMPFVEWDMATPLYSDKYDKYFFDLDGVYQLLDDDEELNPGDEINLIVCRPQKFRHLDSSFWEDVLPSEDHGGDGELPKVMQEKIDELNKIIDTVPAASWLPGNQRTSVILEA